jgi:3-phosphoshikimate 1-carboxyvinyltransferase
MIYSIKNSTSKVKGSLSLPTSKSISNRLLIMSALSGGKLVARDLSDSDDTAVMLRILGTSAHEHNAGHAGTAMRFLTAWFSFIPGEVILTGSERMKNRPIGVLVDLLRQLGAGISYMEKEGYPPLKIIGGSLKGGSYSISGEISSQYISAILMIAPCLKGGLELKLTGKIVSESYIELTLHLMNRAGIKYSRKKNSITVEEGHYRAGIYYTEPDWSAASYWYEMAAIAEDSGIFIKGLQTDSLQGDAAVAGIFESLGVKTVFEKEGAFIVRTDRSRGPFEFDFSLNPDIVQSVVPVCVLREIPFRFTGTQTLRIKETDRIKALYDELRKFGVELKYPETGEWISWDARSKFIPKKDVLINTYDDHRMAMAFAPLCLRTGSILINDPGVVSKSYPGYWDDLKKCGFEISQ